MEEKDLKNRFAGKRVLLYGMGRWIENHWWWLKRYFNIVAAYDRDQSKKEKSEEIGIPFYSLKELMQKKYDTVLITSTFEEEISDYLWNELKLDVEVVLGNKLYEEWMEQHSYGHFNHFGSKYKDLKFYIIQKGKSTKSNGLLSMFNYCVSRLVQADERGYVPVIDMKNCYSCYHENFSQVGKVNIWELFFEQLQSDYKLDDIWEAYNVTISDNPDFFQEADLIMDLNMRKKWHLIYKKYIHLSQKVQKEYEFIRKEIIEPHVKNGEKILGVSVRGTDYTKKKPYKHYIQPTKEQIAEKIREVMEPWGITKIYVNSDEEASIDYMKQQFPGKVFSMDYKRFDSFASGEYQLVGDIQFERENDGYRRGADYLISTLLMQDCQCYMSGKNAACTTTLIMTDGFEHEYIFDDGRYGFEDDAYAFTPDGKPIYVNKNEK